MFIEHVGIIRKKNLYFKSIRAGTKGAIIYLICTRHDKNEVQTFALHRFKSAIVLNSRSLHPVDFDIDVYIESGALGFRVDYNKPTETVELKLVMSESTAQSFTKVSSVKIRPLVYLRSMWLKLVLMCPLHHNWFGG